MGRSLLALLQVSSRWRVVLLNLVLVAALLLYAFVANHHFPIRHWLFLSYARAWAAGLVFIASALCAGIAATGWLLGTRSQPLLRLGERLVVSFAVGVWIFVAGLFVAGLFGLIGRVFFFAWPLLLIAIGARPALRQLQAARRHLRASGIGGFALIRPRGPLEVTAAVLILLSLVAIYLQVITPLNLGADAHWYHLPMAEHYATQGRISAFAEGWYLGAYPQLASLIYTWAFLAPGDLFDHATLASHLEWFLFLATLASVAPLARRLAGRRLPYAGAVVFAFPGLFLYDSSLLTMADHVLGFWVIPIAVALLALGRHFTIRLAVVAGVVTSGALLTKYQGIYVFVPAAMAVVGLGVRQLVRRASFASAALPVLAFAGALLVASSPHWLKNLIFYGDPLYPLLHKYFPARPFHARAAEILDKSYFPPQFALTGTPLQKVLRTAAALFNFSFVPHDWHGFHGDRPVFGSLLTLLMPALLFVRAPRRLWLTIVGIHVGLAVWFVTSHQDRFLQGLMPLMAACTAAGGALLWRLRPARGPLIALFGYQLIACADIYFIRTHAMIGDTPFKAAVDHIADGHKGRYRERRHLWGTLEDLGRVIPKGARVLVHDFTEKLGLGAPAVVDGTEWQGAIDYLALPRTRDVLALWRRLGVTHAAWRPNRGGMSPETLAREAVFAVTLVRHGEGFTEVGGYGFAALASDGRQTDGTGQSKDFLIAWLGCRGDPTTGVYTPAGMEKKTVLREIGPIELAASPADALRDAQAIVLRPDCPGLEGAIAVIGQGFRKMVTAGDVALWTRTPAP
jgi:hypothetical protein